MGRVPETFSNPRRHPAISAALHLPHYDGQRLSRTWYPCRKKSAQTNEHLDDWGRWRLICSLRWLFTEIFTNYQCRNLDTANHVSPLLTTPNEKTPPKIPRSSHDTLGQAWSLGNSPDRQSQSMHLLTTLEDLWWFTTTQAPWPHLPNAQDAEDMQPCCSVGLLYPQLWNSKLEFVFRKKLANVDVSKNNEKTSKSSLLIGFSIIFTIHFGGKIPLFLILGSTPMWSGVPWHHEAAENPHLAGIWAGFSSWRTDMQGFGVSLPCIM